MKKVTLLVACCIMLCVLPVSAQEAEKNSIFVITTFKTKVPDGGSIAERDSLLKILGNVEKQNSKILSRIEVGHLWGSSSEDWVVISQYASMQDLSESAKENTELHKKKWPDEKEREAFFTELGKYFGSHSDEIYSGNFIFQK